MMPPVLRAGSRPSPSGRKPPGPGSGRAESRTAPDDPATRDYRRIARAISHCVSHWPDHPRLSDLARVVGLSDHHFHRLFHRWAGVTATSFLHCLTLDAAKAHLARSSVLASSLDLGLSSPSRLHDLFLRCEAMTPGAFKVQGQGLELRWGIHPTWFGPAVFVVTARGLCGLHFLTAPSGTTAATRAQLPQELQRQWPRATWIRDPDASQGIAHQVQARLTGRPEEPLSVVLHGTPFQLKVWEALLRIPEGQVVSYAGLAAALGRPGAARAVGSAVARNPIGYLIPCHRVLRATGALGGYRWGEERKRAMLTREQVRGSGSGAWGERR